MPFNLIALDNWVSKFEFNEFPFTSFASLDGIFPTIVTPVLSFPKLLTIVPDSVISFCDVFTWTFGVFSSPSCDVTFVPFTSTLFVVTNPVGATTFTSFSTCFDSAVASFVYDNVTFPSDVGARLSSPKSATILNTVPSDVDCELYTVCVPFNFKYISFPFVVNVTGFNSSS